MKHNVFLFVKNHFLLISLLFLLAFAACENEIACVSDNTNVMTISFFKLDTANSREEDTVRFLSIRTEDGKLLYLDTLVTEGIALPLNPSGNQEHFIFEQDTAIDILQLSYDREQQIISPDCGVDQRFYDLQVNQQTFDSVRVRDSELKEFKGPNIAVYFCHYDYDDTIKIRFFKIDEQEKTVRDTINILSVTDDRGNVQASMDSIVSLLVPVNPDASQISLFFKRVLDDGQTIEDDTLVLKYRKQLVQIAECRPQIRYDRLDTVRYSFDSLFFDSKTLDRNNAENISIFY